MNVICLYLILVISLIVKTTPLLLEFEIYLKIKINITKNILKLYTFSGVKELLQFTWSPLI